MMILILSNATRYNNKFLNFEVEEAKKRFINIYVIKESNNINLGSTLASLSQYDVKDYAV